MRLAGRAAGGAGAAGCACLRRRRVPPRLLRCAGASIRPRLRAAGLRCDRFPEAALVPLLGGAPRRF